MLRIINWSGEYMKHTVILYIADRKLNSIFQCFEQDPAKILCTIEEMVFSTKSEVTEERLRETMKNSKNDEERWIAAIGYMSNFFKEDESTIIVA